ncbi:MAG TPA: isomerase, partial [Gammaproteobacteria bacterium]|nr:isomerase [Gammaproteobacteria bacterium]
MEFARNRPMKTGHAHSLHFLVLLALWFGLLSCSSSPPSPISEKVDLDYGLLATTPEAPILYGERVKPLLERRCVVCHGCVDAPCQLKFSSYEGLARGASKELVYDGERIRGAAPSRLFIDANSTAEWRTKGFHPVLAEAANNREENLQQSMMYQMLRLKQLHPQARTGKLSEDLDIRLNRDQVCPKRDEFDKFSKEHPSWGMPYAMPNLSDAEYRTLVQWLAQGAPAPPAAQPSAAATSQIKDWEAFFNGPSAKQQLASRYLYEHLFQAHLHFEDTAAREFYRLVRSSSPPGQPIQEIATTRPFDDPGTAPFYYRLRNYHSSIVAKSHMVYELSAQRMVRYRELFLTPEYSVTELPSYEPHISSNPFLAFRPIPVKSRYRFLLDDAHFIIEGFIKGPVCRGQIALNVIEDQFWVVFFDPDKDLASNHPEFLDEMAEYLELPAEKGDILRIKKAWNEYARHQRTYMNARQAWFEKMPEQDIASAMEYIWDGDGTNPNAALTIFRHFDSASVRNGFAGDFPESAWIIDYPMLERIHYLLVAGFNVFGNLKHQLNTRLYMDFLRMEGEDMYLSFLPTSHRTQIRDSWYGGMRQGMERDLGGLDDWMSKDVVTGYKTDNPQVELFQHMEKKLAPILARDDYINRCQEADCGSKKGSAKHQADFAMQKVAEINGLVLTAFPDLAFVRVKMGGKVEDDLSYTIIRNKAYKNVTSMFSDEEDSATRDYSNDSLTVVDWLEGSY